VKRSASSIAAALVALACGGDSPPAPLTIRVGGEIVGLAWSPTDAVVAARRTPFGVELDLDPRRSEQPLRLSAPQACPLELLPNDAREVELRPWIRVRGGDQSQQGFDAPFTLGIEPGCREAAGGSVEWRQIDGLRVALELEQSGFVARGRTPAIGTLPPTALLPGIVPISPRTRGELVFEATWRGAGHEAKTMVTISAAARATGLPSVAPGQRVLLAGPGWRVRERPRAGRAEVEPHAGLLALRPDARGRWLLEDAGGNPLSIAVGTHAEAALDCGRSDCHSDAGENVKGSRMTSVYARGLRGELPGWDSSCVVGCHTVGEPGLDDGGFSTALTQLGRDHPPAPAPGAWDDLPRPLRRLAGVGCTACHGPGAIPEPSASWAVLRSDVCAVCHDAPPRYPQVQQWTATRMARADRDPAARQRPECRPCHTSAGFVGRSAPVELELGIGCAACHAPHARGSGNKLARKVSLPEGFPPLPASATASRVCIPCHATAEGAPVAASAATLLFASDHPHARIAGGCIGCHGAPRDARNRLDHSFRIDRRTCAPCHKDGVAEKAAPGATVRERAEALWKRLGKTSAARPPHTEPDPKQSAAARLVQIVLEDRAAADHNAPHARALLDEAERLIVTP
jgi:hypothetical protein